MNINKNKNIALITVIEGNFNNINYNKNQIRLYEFEALKCFRYWRKNAGNLKDIDIYCICVTNNEPNKKTIEKLKDLKVNYIHEYNSITNSFNNGFWNKPLGCSILEKKLNYDFFIHIDLDMYIIKELKKNVYCNSCLIYDEIDSMQERQFINNTYKPFNTCYMTCIKSDQIFTKWFDILNNTDAFYYKKYYKSITEDKFEEAAFDLLSYFKVNNIQSVSDVMFGETYTPFKKMKTTNEISFHHYHLYNKNIIQTYNYKKYQKQLLKI
tara:strand:- start:358 stop:1161 length:804 start_codon:yes stop_codon:yes gene_type:complete